MAIITEVKCSRCDKRYSAFRGRCPHCGARRNSKGKYSGDPDNIKGRTIIGVLILMALLAAVITLIIISVRSGGDDKTDPAVVSTAPDDSTVTSVPGVTIEPSPTPPEVSFEPPAPSVQSVTITFSGSTKVDITEKVGTTLTLKAKIVPEDIDIVPVWESSDPAVFDVVPVDTTGLSVKVTMLSPSVRNNPPTLTCTVGDKVAECIIRVNP